MTGSSRDYIFRLRADSQQLAQATEAAAKSADHLAASHEHVARAQAGAKTAGDAFAAGMARQSQQFGTFARTGKLGAQELQQVGYQLNDLAVQVASGQNPLTALVQQGSQLSGTFGGIRPALAALGSLITPVVAGVGALAGGVVALGMAYRQGYSESKAFNDSLILTGNYAGVTAGQVDRMALSIAELTARPIGDVREALASVVGSGKFGPQSIDAVTTAVVTLQKFTGQAADDIVKDLSRLAADPARAAAELNKQYNFLTPQIYAQIRALQEQGKTQEAVALAVGTLTAKIGGQERGLGYLDTALEKSRAKLSGWWDALKGIGRDTTLEDRISSLSDRLRAAREALDRPRSTTSRAGREGLVQILSDEFEAAREVQRLQGRQAVNQAASAAANRKAIEDQIAVRTASGKAKPPKKETPPEKNRFEVLEGEIQDDLERRLRENDERRQEAREQAVDAARSAAQDLRQVNRDLNNSLITDDFARGQAVIAAEEAQIKKRINLAALGAEEQKAIADDLADYVALRNQQLTEDLKPKWERQLEAWQDTQRLMADAHDHFITGFIATGEDMWAQFLTTGKTNLAAFGNLVLDEIARLSYRKTIAPAVAGIGNAIFGAIASAFVPHAKGGAFEGGQVVQAFASGGILGPNGGVLDRPTVFPMRSGAIGLGGEVADEAVLPLRRGRDGKLGVGATGGGQPAAVQLNVQVINNHSGAEVRTEQAPGGGLRVIVDEVVAEVDRRMASGGSTARATASRFGLNNGATLRRRGG
jgi:lambda family phage tail tape measure protein